MKKPQSPRIEVVYTNGKTQSYSLPDLELCQKIVEAYKETVQNGTPATLSFHTVGGGVTVIDTRHVMLLELIP